MGLRVIVSGASGMVGEGVVLRCIASSDIDAILILGRRSSNIRHPKVQELLVSDFMHIDQHQEQLRNYDAMYFCAGVSSVGMDEQQYTAITYTTTLHLARVLVELNPAMSFSYVSGAGTDSTGKGRSMWARVKGKTENDLMALPFRQVLAIRPGYIHPIPGAQHVLKYYKYISWLYPAFRAVFPKHACSMQEVGDAMINASMRAPARAVLEVPDLVRYAAH